MNVLLWSVIVFCVAFLVHVVIWRIHLPKRQTTALLAVFGGTLVFFLAVLLTETMPGALSGLPEYLYVCLFFTAFTCSYIVTFPAIEVDSPSLVITMTIAQAGKDGVSRERFYERLTDDLLVKPRIRDLVADGLVCQDGEMLKLTRKGLLFVKPFIWYRRLMRMQKGG